MKQCCLCGKSGHDSSECGWSEISECSNPIVDYTSANYSILSKSMCFDCGCVHKPYSECKKDTP